MTDRELMQQALEAMGTVGADWICEASHHAKKDQHKWGEPCPLQQRWHIAYQALRERLAQPQRTHWEGCEEVHPECRKQRREWVGLTEEEIALVCGECAASAHRADDISYARAIEAKLKEKNNG